MQTGISAFPLNPLKPLSDSWPKYFKDAWQSLSILVQPHPNEGIYEVLDYDTSLELKDAKGKNALLRKSEKVRFLQNNIIAYQDQAWGNGKILLNYRCSPGIPVDKFQFGYKTIILISLRGVKNRGDVDEFNMTWGIKDGFRRSTGFWATEIDHKTDSLKIYVIFPKVRPPLRASLVEKNFQRTTELGKEHIVSLPDGKWKLAWEQTKPRLFEQYIMNWEW